jgi:hypothetical protein
MLPGSQISSLGLQGLLDYDRSRHMFCMLLEIPLLFVLFVWNFVDVMVVEYKDARMGTTVIWREMIFDFIIFIAALFFLFNYLRRGGGYAGSFWCNPVGVGATALVEFVVQIVMMLHYIREFVPLLFRFGTPPAYTFWRPFFFVFFSIVLILISLYVGIMLFRALHSALVRATYIEGPPLGVTLPSAEAAAASGGFDPSQNIDGSNEQL